MWFSWNSFYELSRLFVVTLITVCGKLSLPILLRLVMAFPIDLESCSCRLKRTSSSLMLNAVNHCCPPWLNTYVRARRVFITYVISYLQTTREYEWQIENLPRHVAATRDEHFRDAAWPRTFSAILDRVVAISGSKDQCFVR